MKEVKLTIHAFVTEEFFKEEVLDIMSKIENGYVQKSIIKDADGGIKEIDMKFEILHDKEQ